MAGINRRRVGGALSRYFAGGSGPSHTSITSALLECDYSEPEDDLNCNKQERITRAFKKISEDLLPQCVDEILEILRNDGYLDNRERSEYVSLVAALDNSGFHLDNFGYRIEDFSKSRAGRSRHTSIDKGGTSSQALLEEGELGMANSNRQIFVSHATADGKIAKEFSKFCERVFDLEKKQILCTSAPEYGLESGEGWIEALRNAILNSELIVFLITESFLESEFCGFELGATWIAKDEHQRFPIRFPEVEADQLSAIPGNWNCPEISEQLLGSLIDRVASLCKIDRPSATDMTSEINDLMTHIRNYSGELKTKRDGKTSNMRIIF